MRPCLLAAATVALLAQQPSDPRELLAQAREVIVARARRLPDYTCVQTVDRQYYRPLRRRFPRPSCAQIAAVNRDRPNDLVLLATDRLRLELKVSHGQEIGAWARSSQFSSRSIFELIGGGAYGTGTLGGFLTDIFKDGGATYQYAGEEKEGGIKLAAYGYQVPVASSHYEVKAGSSWTPTGYSGVFWIDPDSLDLRRLIVDADRMPRETGGCEAATTVEYQEVPVGTGKFVLPLRSSMRLVETDASETRITAAYSGCREYHGEATIRFDDGASGEVRAAAAPTAPLPAGLSISLELTSPIDTDIAAAGDIFTAKLRKPVRISKKLQLPAGAKVKGRIIQMQHRVAEPRHFTISLILESLEVRGTATRLYARLNREDRPASFVLPPVGQSPLAAAFVFNTEKSRYIVPRGYRSNWVTVKPPLDETR